MEKAVWPLSNRVSSQGIFRVPWGVILDHGIHDGEQLPHTGDDHDLAGFAGKFESFCEEFDLAIEANSGNGRHVQDRSNVGSAAPDEALPPMFPTVFCQRGDARQCSNFTAIELAEFGTLSEHRQTGDGSHTRNAA